MEAIKIRATIDTDGVLRVQLPTQAQGSSCEVIVLYEPRTQETTLTDWYTFVNETYDYLLPDPPTAGTSHP